MGIRRVIGALVAVGLGAAAITAIEPASANAADCTPDPLTVAKFVPHDDAYKRTGDQLVVTKVKPLLGELYTDNNEYQFIGGGTAPQYGVMQNDSYHTEASTSSLVAFGRHQPITSVFQFNVSAVLETLPMHGTVDLNPDGTFTYTASTPGSTLSDQFTYRIQHGDFCSVGFGTVRISTFDQEATPNLTGVDDEYTMVQGTTLEVSGNQLGPRGMGVMLNDPFVSQRPVEAALDAPQPDGTLVWAGNGAFEYTPPPGFVGDKFIYYRLCQASDGEPVVCDGCTLLDVPPPGSPFCTGPPFTTAPVKVTIHVLPPPPADANANQYQVNEDGTLQVNAANGLTANDGFPQNATVTLIQPDLTNLGGELTLNDNGSFTYTPPENFPPFGGAEATFLPYADVAPNEWDGGLAEDVFYYSLCVDDDYCSEPTPVVITVNPVDDRPIANPDAATATEGGEVNISPLTNDTDADVPSSSVSGLPSADYAVEIVDAPTAGTASVISNSRIRYAAGGVGGEVTFTYRVCPKSPAGAQCSVKKTITVDVKAAQRAKNPGFEKPKLDVAETFRRFTSGQKVGAWKVTSGSVDLIPQSNWAAKAGSQSLELAGSGKGTVTQNLSLPSSASPVNYRVSFALAGNMYCGDRTMRVGVLWNGVQVKAFTFDTTGHSPGDPGWVQRKVTVTKTPAGGASLGFSNLSAAADGCGAAIDKVTVKTAL
ncbi:MAG TPA: Ig-like domain-containing protein [Actinomycetes bacterium]|nr:Ig-like domain-containing protein [Actinomycetes bacterium]